MFNYYKDIDLALINPLDGNSFFYYFLISTKSLFGSLNGNSRLPTPVILNNKLIIEWRYFSNNEISLDLYQINNNSIIETKDNKFKDVFTGEFNPNTTFPITTSIKDSNKWDINEKHKHH